MKRCFSNYSARLIGTSEPTRVSKPTLFVVGGLYGNRAALSVIESRARREDAQVCFNGDFNFFNVRSDLWNDVNERVLKIGRELSIVGNVELSACDGNAFAGCGCAYPSYVGDATPKLADQIVERLHHAAENSLLNRQLIDLPQYRVLDFAGQRIAILHGDFDNISGWKLALEAMPLSDKRVSALLRVPLDSLTPQEYLDRSFSHANVSLVCCSHTCVAYAQNVSLVEGSPMIIFNNGAAGIPNFENERWGVMTRISVDMSVPKDSLYGGTIGALRVDAVPVPYDHASFVEEFLELHPENSAAWSSYWKRIQGGLRWWTVNDALLHWTRSFTR